MNFKTIVTIIIPSIYSWLLASLLLLIYSFDILEFVESSPTNPFKGLGILLLLIILILVIFMLYFTGSLLDRYPKYLRVSVTIGMLGSSIFIILLVLFINQSTFLLITLGGLAFFFGILLTSSGTLFAGLTDMWFRGKIYSYLIFLFIILALASILLGGLISSPFPESEIFSHSWVSILLLIGVLGVFLTLSFFLLTRRMGTPWIPDKWPTRFEKIIGRRSVRAYLTTHFLLYCMLGIIITSFSRIGDTIFTTTLSVTLPALGEFVLPKDKTFWFLVLIGDLIGIIPAGFLADKWGRKNLIVVTIYGIVFSALIFGLEGSYLSFLISALIVGISFALLHPTLDSSIWADLSPRDGLGRYYGLGFISLAFGLGIGSGLGHWLFPPEFTSVEAINYILIILAILAAFPLFWVADSYKPLDFTLLLVIEGGGLPIFDYSFQKRLDVSVELTLLSGALTAVSSFMNETMKEKGDLNLVRHGTHFILTDKVEDISAAVFSNKQDPELHKALHEFLARFCAEFTIELKTWNGARSLFDNAVDIAEEVFGHLAPSKNLPEY